MGKRDTHKSPRGWVPGGKRGKMERKRDERVKGAITEPVPETDPNGSRKENGRRQRLETDVCGDGEAALQLSQRERLYEKEILAAETQQRRTSKTGARESNCEPTLRVSRVINQGKMTPPPQL